MDANKKYKLCNFPGKLVCKVHSLFINKDGNEIFGSKQLFVMRENIRKNTGKM